MDQQDYFRWTIETERRMARHDGRISELDRSVQDTRKRVSHLEDHHGWMSMPRPSAIREWFKALAPWFAVGLLVTGNIKWDQFIRLL